MANLIGEEKSGDRLSVRVECGAVEDRLPLQHGAKRFGIGYIEHDECRGRAGEKDAGERRDAFLALELPQMQPSLRAGSTLDCLTSSGLTLPGMSFAAKSIPIVALYEWLKRP
jgi:hypothetical protein